MTTCACGNCQFFDNRSKSATSQKDKDSGLCRYNPPMPPLMTNEPATATECGRLWRGRTGAATSRPRSSAS